MKTRNSRREFLRRAGMSLGYLGVGSTVFDTVLIQFFQKAMAQELNKAINPSGYYIHFSLPGGPPRWMFDLLLTPDGLTSSNFVAGGFGTTIEKSGSEFTAKYNVEKHVVGKKTVYLPPVWNMDLSKQDFSSLLPHTVFIRGLDMEINNHALSNARQVAPTIGGLSINGMVADRAERPMPSIIEANSGAATAFKSKKGLGASTIAYTENATTNPVGTILKPFQNFPKERAVHAGHSVRLQEQAFKEFEKLATQRGIASSAITNAYDNAMALIDQDIYRLSELWANTVAKYRSILNEALHPSKGTLPGIFNTKVSGNKNGPFRFNLNAADHVELADIRDMVTPSMTSPRMAENFALAEILLDTATSNMTLSLAPLTTVFNGKANFNMTHDQHYVGSVVSTMMTTLFYRGVLGCMTELVSALKAKGIFDRTVIHISSEFNRTPKNDHSGSDHGFMGSNTTLITGMVQETQVVGNIQKASYSNTYTGTFGVATPYVLDNFNRPIQVNDVARTITAMLGVDDIVTNGRSLLIPVNGKWVLRKAEAKNV